MPTYIFTWNPNRWHWDEGHFQNGIPETEQGRRVEERWSCGNRRSFDPDARVFLLRQGIDRGLIASGCIASQPEPHEHWDESRRGEIAYYVRCNFDVLLPVADVLPTATLIRSVRTVNWNKIQGSGIEVPPDAAAEIELLWARHLARIGRSEFPLPEEVIEGRILTEGAVRTVTVNFYERNPKARRKCIEHYGATCVVCRFRFADFYGDLGEGYIHVHHLLDLATIGQEYQVNPIEDLRPVCPNCHAMLHQTTPAIAIDELRTVVEEHR